MEFTSTESVMYSKLARDALLGLAGAEKAFFSGALSWKN